MEAREGMWFVWDYEDRLRPSWIVGSRNSECPKCQISNSLICFDKSFFFFFLNFYFNGLGLEVMVFSCNVLNFCPFHTEWKHQQHCTYWFFTRMYGTCYWTFGNCYNSQIETDASCGAVCVCVEVLEAPHWALLGSETQESILEWAVPQRRRARDWLGGKLEWPWPARLLQSPEWGASSDCQQIHPTPPALFLEGMWCTNGHVCWFLSHT